MFFIISIIVLLIAGLDIAGIIADIATGTKVKGKCTDYVPLTEENAAEEDLYFGSVFEYKDNEEIKTAYTMENIQYKKDKAYKILISKYNEKHCELIRVLNKCYIRDLFFLSAATLYFLSEIKK